MDDDDVYDFFVVVGFEDFDVDDDDGVMIMLVFFFGWN